MSFSGALRIRGDATREVGTNARIGIQLYEGSRRGWRRRDRATHRQLRGVVSTRRRVSALLAVVIVVVGTFSIVIGRKERAHTPRRAVSTRGSQPTEHTTRPLRAATTTVTTAPAGPPWSVRQTTLEFFDPTRTSPARGGRPVHSGRVLRTTLRWPVSSNGQVAAGRPPLMVFAHGYNLSAATYTVMLDDLTRAGIVVAAPEFPGESTSYSGPAVESDLVNEPCDMEFVAASLEHEPPPTLQNALRNAPLIMAGHSDGADAAASAGYASSCSSVPIRGVVALSPDDVPITDAFRFGNPPPLLAMSGNADEVTPVARTQALYQQAPGPAWLVTIDGGSHVGTFTTDPDLARISRMIADFVFMVADRDTRARVRLTRAAGGRIHVQSR